MLDRTSFNISDVKDALMNNNLSNFWTKEEDEQLLKTWNNDDNNKSI